MQCMLSGGKLAFTPYNQVLIAAAGAIPFIVEMLGADNTAAVRSRAVWALLRLMEGSASNKAKAADAGALAPLLRLAADEEGSEARPLRKQTTITPKRESSTTLMIAAGKIVMMLETLAWLGRPMRSRSNPFPEACEPLQHADAPSFKQHPASSAPSSLGGATAALMI